MGVANEMCQELSQLWHRNVTRLETCRPIESYGEIWRHPMCQKTPKVLSVQVQIHVWPTTWKMPFHENRQTYTHTHKQKKENKITSSTIKQFASSTVKLQLPRLATQTRQHRQLCKIRQTNWARHAETVGLAGLKVFWSRNSTMSYGSYGPRFNSAGRKRR